MPAKRFRDCHVALIGTKFMGRAHSNAWLKVNKFFDVPRRAVMHTIAGRDVTIPYRSNFEQPAFEAAVEKCREYIKAGDIFQVVLSQRLQTETRARPSGEKVTQ